MLGDWQIDGLTRITVPPAAVSRRFSVWTTDWTEASRVVTPEFASTLAAHAASTGWRGRDAALDRGRFLHLLPRGGGRFKASALFRSLRFLPWGADHLLDEILVVHRLIASLRGGVAVA